MRLPVGPRSDPERSSGRRSGSIAYKLVVLTLLGELVFSLTLGVAVGVYVAEEMRQHTFASYRHTASAIAASFIPMVMDKDAAAVQMQIQSLVELSPESRLECLRIVDGTGRLIAEAGSTGPDCCETQRSEGLAGWLEADIIASPLSVNDVELGTVTAQFEAVPLSETLFPAVLVSLIVMASVNLVSVPWVAWLSVRLLLEPLAQVQDAADGLSAGERDIDVGVERNDEIGRLARTLDDLAGQLKRREAERSRALARTREALALERRARDELQEMSRMKSDFMAVASHELKTPLAAIRMYSELLSERDDITEREDVGELVSGLRASVFRLTSITSDLLDSAMLERGIMPLTRASIDLVQVAGEAASDANRLGEARGIEVGFETEVDSLPVYGDAVRLRQVIDNLTSNAMKFSFDGMPVDVRCLKDEDQAVVEVCDRGTGIDPRKAERLFTLFGRLDSADNRRTAGLGLGLAISARIVEAHGGTITWRSRDDLDETVFQVRIPSMDGSLEISRCEVLILDGEGGRDGR